MYLQNVDNVYDLIWTESPKSFVTYGDVYLQNEIEMSAYNFEHANVEQLFKAFENCEIDAPTNRPYLALPAYEMVMKASHTFNLLDAKAISVLKIKICFESCH